MSEQRPDTDERDEPGGTPAPGHGNLPGAYEADETDQERGRAVKPGN